MKFTLFLLIALCLNLQANDVYQQLSSSKEQIISAKCFNHPSIKRNSNYYETIIRQVQKNDREKGLTKNATAGGVILKNESIYVSSAYTWMTSYLNYKLKPTSTIDFWHIFKDGHCSDALCASQRVFGKERGAFYLGFLVETGLNLSHLGYDKLEIPLLNGETTPSQKNINDFSNYYKVKEWQRDELTHLLEGIYSLPHFLFPLPMTRLAKAASDHSNGPGLHANALITMYPDILNQDKQYQMYTVVHEIGHIIGSHLNLDTSKEWTSISWTLNKEENKVIKKDYESFVSPYAQQSFFEDFAESFAAFRFNPKHLKKHSPEKFEFIRTKVFKGLDYLTEKDCSDLLPLGSL